MDMMTVSHNVKLLRVAAGLEQQELARLADVSKAYVSRLEGGQTQAPRVPELSRIAKALGTTLDGLQTPLQLRPTDSISSIAGTKGADVQSEPQHDAIRTRQHVRGGADPSGGETLVDEVDEDVFSVIVVGECLYPEVEPGDVLIMSRSKQPQIGDIVSVIVHGERHIKTVYMRRNGQIILHSRRGELVLPADGALLEGVATLHARTVMTNKMSIKTQARIAQHFDIGSGNGVEP